MIANDLPELIRRLRANPAVLGIARYGGRAAGDTEPGGDFDIFVIVRERPSDLESVHFHCGGIPVDMNVRDLADLRREAPLTEIDHAISDAELLHDPLGEVASLAKAARKRWAPQPARLTEHEVNFSRFCQRHALDKVRHRLDAEPLLADVLLSTNVYWLIQAYFRVRSLPFLGESPALCHLRENEPRVSALIKAFYAASSRAEKLSISDELTEAVLEPIGGPWRDGETLSFGTHADAAGLRQTGDALLRALVGGE
jgi:hypothetical protein